MTSLWDHILTWLGQNIQGPMTLAAAIQAAASFVGFFIVIFQLFHLRRNLLGATQDKLYDHYTDVCKLFMQYPELRPYFYPPESDAGATAAPERSENFKEELAPRIALMCELILGLIEHAALQKKNVPRDIWESYWRPYAIERLKAAKALRKFYESNSHWYSIAMQREMVSLLDDLDKPETASGKSSKDIEPSEPPGE
jgi:hypothetical protein